MQSPRMSALALALAVAFDFPGPLPQRRSRREKPEGRRAWTRVVFRRDRDVSSKNPAGGVDPRHAVPWARRQGRVSLGYFSLHEQREVTRSCEAGAKALLSSFRFHAWPLPWLGLCLGLLPITLIQTSGEARTEAGSKAFAPLRGASYFSLLVQRKDSQKKHAPAYAPSPLRVLGPLRRRDFSTRHPCRVEKRRASLHVAPSGSCPSAPSLRKGIRSQKLRSQGTSKSESVAPMKNARHLPGVLGILRVVEPITPPSKSAAQRCAPPTADGSGTASSPSPRRCRTPRSASAACSGRG